MPSTYARTVVDFDGDGRHDLIGSMPDALGSATNYLKEAGWRTGQSWDYGVKVPTGFPASLIERGKRQPLSVWVARGVKRAGSQPLPDGGEKAAILLPTGAQDPVSLVYRNYDVTYSYDATEGYALTIVLLSDHPRGGSGLVASWPADDPGISWLKRRQLQKALLARGYDTGEADGLIGVSTCKTVQAERKRLGLTPTDGRAGHKILEALKGTQP